MYLIPEIVAINADSPNKDGAWEFISFLLSQEAQLEISVDNHVSGYPSNQKAFEVLRER